MRRIVTLIVLIVIVALACRPHWLAVPGEWVADLAEQTGKWIANHFGPDTLFTARYEIMGLVSVVLLSVLCGALSSMVVSNRMAFFSDALAHCAYAGVALGVLFHLAGLIEGIEGIVGVTIVFGVTVGLAIAFVREHTALASDTVIGVFFA